MLCVARACPAAATSRPPVVARTRATPRPPTAPARSPQGSSRQPLATALSTARRPKQPRLRLRGCQPSDSWRHCTFIQWCRKCPTTKNSALPACADARTSSASSSSAWWTGPSSRISLHASSAAASTTRPCRGLRRRHRNRGRRCPRASSRVRRTSSSHGAARCRATERMSRARRTCSGSRMRPRGRTRASRSVEGPAPVRYLETVGGHPSGP